MANYSVNQVLQLYVAKAYNASVTAASAAGTIGAIKTIDDVLGKQVMFLYKGADNETVLRSDFIPVGNIGYAKAIAAEDMAVKMRKVSVTIAENPEAGKDYILGINFKNFFSSGDASQYYKDAAVHATSGMTKAQFAQAMVDSLNMAFAREYGASATSNPYLAFSVDGNKIVIAEKPQEWALGTKKARRIYFDVMPGTVYDGTDDVVWAAKDATTGQYYTEETPTTTVGNGQKIADLEWFAAGERGDQYRNVGWPNVITTQYLVDPSKTYSVLEIHYAFTDSGVNSYRTEKEITIVAEDKAELNKFITAFNTATGLSVATLPTT